MPFRFDRKEHLALAWTLAKWMLLGTWVGILAGAASFVFLRSLEWATSRQAEQPNLLFALPLAGALIAFAYDRFGRGVAMGNDLLLEQIHNPSATVPFRMAPMILLSTVATHLFGGSAGREGTALQMGGTLADLAAGPFRLGKQDRRMMLMAGVSAGFGSVFGTPMAGAVFGLEVLATGRMKYDALVPCLTASIVGDLVCRGLGLRHHLYEPAVGPLPPIDARMLLWCVLAGAVFAGAGALFSESTHAVQTLSKRWVGAGWARALLGGGVVVGMTLALGSRDYNGLSLPLIEASFGQKVLLGAFLVKIAITAVTLGTGFKGGEVTPLFCVGATLGNSFAQVAHLPLGMFAALGFVAVFAGAANTPLACAIMGIELFGGGLAVPLAVVCTVSYLLGGHRGIYSSQRIGESKSSHVDVLSETVGEVRASGVRVRRPRIFERRGTDEGP